MKIDQIVYGKIEKIEKTHMIVNLKSGYKGMCHISKVSDYYVQSLKSMFKVGETYQFIVTSVEENEKRVKLSWKSIHPRFQKNAFEYDIEETENGFKNLYEKTMKGIEND